MVQLNHRRLYIRIIELVLFRWKQENRDMNILQTKSCDNLVDLFTILKCLQGSGGVILHDIWPVLNHHITLFSLYEFCLIEVFSSKVFNEVISTKLYASSLTFPHRGFYEWWLQAYFLLEFVWDYSHYPKDIVYSLFFPQGFWGDKILEEHLTDHQMKLDWSRGSVTKYYICDQSKGCDSFPQGTHLLGYTPSLVYKCNDLWNTNDSPVICRFSLSLSTELATEL